MNFAVIAPTANLNTLCYGRPVQMCLAPFCNDLAYFQWYQAAMQDSIIILDNGVWEGKRMHLKEYVELAEALNPHVVVVPDEINNAKETLKLSQAFHNVWDWDQFYGRIKLMYVPQGSLPEQVEQYNNYKHIFPWIGLTRACNRVEFVRLLKETKTWDRGIHHHALGMQDGDLHEIVELGRMGVKSFDSSNPIWRATGMQGDFNPTIPVDEQRALTFIKGIDLTLEQLLCTSK